MNAVTILTVSLEVNIGQVNLIVVDSDNNMAPLRRSIEQMKQDLEKSNLSFEAIDNIKNGTAFGDIEFIKKGAKVFLNEQSMLVTRGFTQSPNVKSIPVYRNGTAIDLTHGQKAMPGDYIINLRDRFQVNEGFLAFNESETIAVARAVARKPLSVLDRMVAARQKRAIESVSTSVKEADNDSALEMDNVTSEVSDLLKKLSKPTALKEVTNDELQLLTDEQIGTLPLAVQKAIRERLANA